MSEISIYSQATIDAFNEIDPRTERSRLAEEKLDSLTEKGANYTHIVNECEPWDPWTHKQYVIAFNKGAFRQRQQRLRKHGRCARWDRRFR